MKVRLLPSRIDDLDRTAIALRTGGVIAQLQAEYGSLPMAALRPLDHRRMRCRSKPVARKSPEAGHRALAGSRHYSNEAISIRADRVAGKRLVWRLIIEQYWS